MDEHTAVVVDASGDVIGVPVRSSAEGEVVVVREGVPEEEVVPVGINPPERREICILGCLVILHGFEVPDSGAYLSGNSDDREESREIILCAHVSPGGELVPELLLPVKLLRGVHQVQTALRTE